MIRDVDDSGVSGVGVVAEGIEFTDGSVALRWCVPRSPKSTVLWGSVTDLLAIHGHGGHTRLEWFDSWLDD